jgi:hypothetical protein
MFCPKCAVENQDQTRFCRSCGTDLDVVSQALGLSSEFDSTSESKIELMRRRQQLRIDGIQNIVRGALIFITGILFGIPLAFFGENSDWHKNWILIWLIFCGWLPVWGAFMMGTGFTNLIHSSITQRKLDAQFTTFSHVSPLEQPTQRIKEATEENPVNGNERTTTSMNRRRISE